MKSVKINLAEVVAKAEKAFKTSEAVKKSAVQLQKMVDTAKQTASRPGQPGVK